MKRTPHTNIEYTVLSKLIRRKLKEDFQNFKAKRLLEAAEKRKSLKKCRRSLMLYKTSIAGMKNEKGERVTVRKDIEELVKSFYTRLYSSKINITPPLLSNSTTAVPEVLVSEVRFALSEMSKGKMTGKDGISIEVQKAGGLTLYRAIAQRFSHYLRNSKIPSVWKESNTILLHKKGDTEDLKNYRPICLLDHLSKLFTRIIYNRLKTTLDEQQPKEQAGFRGGYSTIDYIFVLNQMIERAREYRLPLCLLFVDFEKAFDNVEVNAVLNALKSQGVEDSYIKILAEANSGCTTDINIFGSPITIPIAKGEARRHYLAKTVCCLSRIGIPEDLLERRCQH
ncbi:hypothetical protein AB6A40_011278 [Gnathostoma spinigerum]|uniref:Reverse transcriptase domain-containing protein n=1 Tax=Gnathostoma spinigerum TaxID=75299 RepID=A0ABD6EX77_9BILA